ncbi:endoplasmic reticulum-Golgi intermediate compartment protein 2 [Venturia canescens]|uniref:endoplasmic reticulum-Golgi intermediate compartment protein 2 n=1 Tax=Venturia canescens TaxID=32260 RepID=UPI001C9C1987|nr:endoplasmic reticulum-Golgi intermediate compartment protein 2 [Venturia canescens]
MLRRRNVNLKNVKELDAFPKVPDTCIDKSAVGGTFSLVTFCLIVYLIYSETRYFLDSRLQFKYEPDTEIDAKLKLNIDITVAMPCSRLGADILDATNQNLRDFEPLTEEDTWWELSVHQRSHFDALKHMNSYLREEYHAIHELLWKSQQVTFFGDMPERTDDPGYPPNACRIHGSLDLNKVAGNFHITAGKSLSLPTGHVHISAYMSFQDYNFTHRINRFSFGEASPGIIHPLDGDEKIADENMMLYQYFVEIVPTDISTLLHTSKSYQYSVKDHQRPINHNKGSHGIPGIFFKYDTSALKVKVIQQRDSFAQFLVKLCAIVGGVFVTSGLINSVVQTIWYIACCKFLKSPESKNDRRVLITQDLLTEKPNVGPINLINVPTPPCIDLTLHAQ